jgi:LmbE family N-acetylglucosaminyl deacetylase
MIRFSIQIISPHQDDAAFSMGSTLGFLSCIGLPVTIVNCFTISEYAPLSEMKTPLAISQLRHGEDLEFVARLGKEVSLIDLDFADAPIRLQISADRVCGLSAAYDSARGNLSAKLREVLTSAPVIVPLGLGGHVDHVLARSESLLAANGRPLALYEELPYAYRSDDVEAEAREILKTCGIQASPYTYGSARANLKHRLVHCYSSQASAGSLDEIALYRGGSERLWMTSEFRETWIKTGLHLK